MLFNSYQFLFFFPIVITLYYIFPAKYKNYWLLLASYYFYMSWNTKYALLILFSTIISYISGRIIEKCKGLYQHNVSKQSLLKKYVLCICIISNLLILFYFKYTNFLLGILSRFTQIFHINFNIPQFDIILPVGISFYTFQVLGYVIDVYRNDKHAETNFINYALFVSFFPQLLAGPIARSRSLLPQLNTPAKFKLDVVREGVLLMIWGFFLQSSAAYRIAIFVNTVYNSYNSFPGIFLATATILLALQIYCDFYGYSVIAMGAAKIIGIELAENFNAPYLSTTVATFWRNWHISLTSWFKDYLYIPLGGSRRGKLRKYLNKLIVFLASGLWHGAAFTFIVWGGINGIYQILGEIFSHCGIV